MRRKTSPGVQIYADFYITITCRFRQANKNYLTWAASDINVTTVFFWQRIMTGNGFFSVAEHTPLIFTESSGTGRTLFRLLVADASGENEGYLLAETVPNWAVDVTVKVLTEYPFQWSYDWSQFSLIRY